MKTTLLTILMLFLCIGSALGAEGMQYFGSDCYSNDSAASVNKISGYMTVTNGNADVYCHLNVAEGQKKINVNLYLLAYNSRTAPMCRIISRDKYGTIQNRSSYINGKEGTAVYTISFKDIPVPVHGNAMIECKNDSGAMYQIKSYRTYY